MSRWMLPLLALCFAVDSAAQEPAPENAFAQYSRHLVIVDGDRGVGSAAVIKFRGNPLIVTNAHVLSGNKQVSFRTLNAKKLTPGKFGVARETDLAVFTQEDVQDGLEILRDAEQHATVGDEVMVLGNSLGGSVATELRGKIVGLGPELVEVDAPFAQGNSGSPIIHVKTGKVVGIATFATWAPADPLTGDSRLKEVRRFGVRLDTVTQWEYPSWDKFRIESQQLIGMARSISTLMALARDILDDGKVETAQYAQADPRLRQRIAALERDIKKPGMASTYYAGVKSEFLRWIENELAAASPSVRAQGFTQFHGRVLREMLEARTMLRTGFSQLRTVQKGGKDFDLGTFNFRQRGRR